ncbi:MAG TPA: hypothetical protein V6C76_02440 [Drouetiella sp.]
MRDQILNLMLTLTAVVAAAAPAQAQQAAAPTYQPAQNLPPQSQWRPGVRYTTGSYVVTPAGFEKTLVGGDKNLGHWNWSPVIGYSQGSLRTSRQAVHVTTPEPQHKSVYVKPIHVPLPVVNHPAPAPLVAKADPLPMQPVSSSSNRRSNTDTHIVLSYNKDYRVAAGDNFRSSGDVHGILAHQSVGAKFAQNAQY